MAQTPSLGSVDDSRLADEGDEMKRDTRARFTVWLVLSALFLGFIAFGSVEARIWRTGQLYFRDRGVAHVWGYLGRHLPEMPAQLLITTLYYLSLAVMVGGTVLGLWYFLQGDGDLSDLHSDTAAKTVPPDHD